MSGPDDTAEPADPRSAAESAWDTVSASEGGEAAPLAPAEPAPDAPPIPSHTQTDEAAAAPGKDDARTRDEHGRFTKPPEGQKPAPAVAAKPGEKAPPPTVKPTAPITAAAPAKAPTGTELKPPGSWSPMAREKWAALPPEVQADVHRREKEHAQTLERAAPTFRVGQAFQQMVAPFEGLMRAQGAEPLQAVGAVLQSYAVLSMGSQEAKGQVLAKLFRSSGLPIEALAAAIDGAAPAPGQAQGFDPSRFEQQLLAKIDARNQQQRQQHVVSQATQEMEQYLQGVPFGEDLREDMGDLMAAAAQRGKVLTAEQAYRRALQFDEHRELRDILKQREDAQAAEAKQAQADKARAAGSSVRGQPAQSPPAVKNGQWKDPRDATLAAWESLSG